MSAMVTMITTKLSQGSRPLALGAGGADSTHLLPRRHPVSISAWSSLNSMEAPFPGVPGLGQHKG